MSRTHWGKGKSSDPFAPLQDMKVWTGLVDGDNLPRLGVADRLRSASFTAMFLATHARQNGEIVNLTLILIIALTVLVLHGFTRGRMSEPTSVDPSVIAAFRKLYRQQLLMAVTAAPFFVWVMNDPSSGGSAHGLLLVLAWVGLAAICVFTYRHWRCPKCGAYLGRNPMYYGTCPGCGTALREPRGS